MLQNDGNQLFRINHVVIFPAFVPSLVKTINGLLRKIPVVYFRNFNILPRIQPLHAAKMAVADFAVLVIPVFAGNSAHCPELPVAVGNNHDVPDSHSIFEYFKSAFAPFVLNHRKIVRTVAI